MNKVEAFILKYLIVFNLMENIKTEAFNMKLILQM